MLDSGHRSSAGPLALAFALLVVYATLYPFSGWRWPPGLDLWQLLALPWPPWRDRFDLVANFVGYMPMGALAYGAGLRNGLREWTAVAVAFAAVATLSFGLEVAQYFVPARVPSLIDWVLNSAGAIVGIFIGSLLNMAGVVARWQAMRDRWFVRPGAAWALVLLLLWPVGLLFPAPVPLGLGQVGGQLRQLAEAAFDGTPWADAVVEWLLATAPSADAPLAPAAEATAIALGLLAPCLIAYAATRPGWRRVLLAFGALALALAAMTLSTALNFGPQHAFTWLGPVTMPALVAGLVLANACALLPRRLAAAFGLMALTALVAIVAQAPADPYYAESLQAWEQGRFIRFHGLARWVGWLWPYFAIAWFLWRVGARDEG